MIKVRPKSEQGFLAGLLKSIEKVDGRCENVFPVLSNANPFHLASTLIASGASPKTIIYSFI